MISRIVVAYSSRGRDVDGIRDHSRRIAEQLADGRTGMQVECLNLREGSSFSADTAAALKTLGSLDGGSAVFLQYNPFSFARWGFAPWLPVGLAALRARRSRPFIALMVHEPYVPMNSAKWIALGLWQRLQLAALRACADVTFTSISAWEAVLRKSLPRGPVRHLPVGSNFPDRRRARESFRNDLGVGDEELVVSALGRDHPSWLAGYVVAAANAIAAAGRHVVLLTLGATAPALSGLDPAVRLERPGKLDPDQLAGRLAASDLFLAPLIDGVSTRRGSVMAGLQHALPLVGTDGPLTDPVFAQAGEALSLTRVGDEKAFAAAARRLALEPAARERMGAAARRFYEAQFDWPVVAHKLLEALPAS
jgi:glycosyltransferase involved in cell wall biosynthesis